MTAVQICGEGIKGMRVLDREKFAQKVNVPWVTIKEGVAAKAVKILKPYLLKMENFKPVQDGDEAEMLKAYLNPNAVQEYESLTEQERINLEGIGVTADSFHVGEVQLRYENWKADEVLRAVLPDEGLSSYSKIGHVLHLNLRDHLRPYGELIGQVMLDKVKGCRCVVNKADSIESTYRNFKMELLAGEPDTVVEVKENYCRYQLDFAQVYWNPRLSTEHERIVLKLQPWDVLYDVFAGVGPFAVPAARKKCNVLANDLNPESYKWLLSNVELNKVGAYVHCFNKDGRDFIRTDVAGDIAKYDGDGALHVAMNLPAIAIEFLDAFVGLLNKEDAKKLTVHVYAFSTEDNPALDVQHRVEKVLGTELGSNLLEVFRVRDVSPKKEMMRVSFVMPEHVLCAPRAEDESDEPKSKKLCLDEPPC